MVKIGANERLIQWICSRCLIYKNKTLREIINNPILCNVDHLSRHKSIFNKSRADYWVLLTLETVCYVLRNPYVCTIRRSQ